MLSPFHLFFTFKIPVNCLHILPGSLNPHFHLTLPYSLSPIYEGNTEEENNSYVVFKRKVHELAGKKGISEGGGGGGGGAFTSPAQV
jgi:hypothetical protein